MSTTLPVPPEVFFGRTRAQLMAMAVPMKVVASPIHSAPAPAETQAPELRRALQYVGIFTRVAKKIKRCRSTVYRVANGERKSQTISDAIVAEVRRIERGGSL